MSGSSGASINFSVLPVTTLRLPGVFFEIDGSRANSGQVNRRALLLGQMTAAGTAPAGTPVIAAGVGAAQSAFGYGSMLSLMYQWYRKQDPFGEVWFLPFSPTPPGGTGTNGAISFGGTATAAGFVPLYVGGTRVPVAVNVGDSANTVAAETAAAINDSAAELPVTVPGYSSGPTVIPVTRWNGPTGADIDIRSAYLGVAGGESLPAGLTLSIIQQSGGGANPDLAAPLANLSNRGFDFIACPFNDTTSLNEIQAFLNDVSGTWSWESQLYGQFFTAYRGTFGAGAAWGEARNDRHGCGMPFYDSPTPPFLWAAQLAGATATSVRANPAQPLAPIALDVLAPPVPSQFTPSEMNTLLYDGCSTFSVDQSNTVYTNRLVTFYQTNAAGAPDTAFLDVETNYQLEAGLQFIIIGLQSQFVRRVLVDDGNVVPVGSALVTPSMILSAANSLYRQLCLQGLMQNPDQFAQQSTAENAGGGQVRLLLPFILANQLRQIDILAQFTKP